MPEDYPRPTPKTSAGYRPLTPIDISKNGFNSAYAYIAVAAGVGVLAGLGIAVAAGYGNITAKRPPSPPPAAQASGLPTFQASYTGAAPSLLSAVDPSRKAEAATPKFLPAGDSAAKKSARTHKSHGIGNSWPLGTSVNKPDDGTQDNGRREPNVSPSPATSAGPTALELATAAAAAGPFVLGIQGDATVANYDVATGTVETYEGSSFVLNKTASESSAIAWDDFPFNVHYRCDQNGNCTMNSHGATASARIMR